MTTFWTNLASFFMKTAPYWGLFLTALISSLILTPLCRELARACGMVDKPSARRINKTPIPRSGGLAIFLAMGIAMALGVWLFADHLRASDVLRPTIVLRIQILAAILCVIGLLDDKFSLPPVVKLLGQIGIAFGAYFWCDVGFHSVLPDLPEVLDCAFTVFWIVGAINAFNLIDGLDGLATGLACIASVGMAGALFFVGNPENALGYFALVGACLGFLRYNFNPASVFLGDTGSMFLGFMLSTLPLLTESSNSFFVGVGVPILAMGVPIFDTSLAILRRSVRAALRRRDTAEDGNTHVMQADTDHLHHRILRKFASQRKAALGLYGLALFFVLLGLGGLALRGRAVSLYIIGFMVATVIIFRDMRRIELWDMGRLLNAVAHDPSLARRRRFHLLRVPLLLVADVTVLVVVWLFTSMVLGRPLSEAGIHRWLPLRAIPIFLSLVVFRAYSTLWSRALLSNYVRLALAVFVGTGVSVALVVAAELPHTHLFTFSVAYATLVLLGLVFVRTLRQAIRDFFYALGAGRLLDTPGTSRILVYGAGLRYRAFRRELVRTTSDNRRVIVGILDDDLLLRGTYIGGVRICGTLEQAPAIIKRLNADAVVVACQLTPARREVVRKMCAACGVPVTIWTCEETAL